LISDLVAQHGRVTLYDVRVLPPDRSMIDIALGHDRIMTIEDGTRHGGAGSLMVSVARERAQDLNAPLPTTRILGIPRAYFEHHRPDDLLEGLGLDPKGLATAIERLLSVQPKFPTVPPRAPRAPYLGVGDVNNTSTSS
jgi:deoxyxylulose-5-phosphate synthase